MIFIIAYGNSLRQDDGAGLALGRLLEDACRAKGLAVERIESFQLLPEMTLQIVQKNVTAVIFADTRAITLDEKDPGIELQPLRAKPGSPSMGHQLDPSALLLYLYMLYNQEPPAWIVTAPGFEFGHGEGLSPGTQQALTAAGPELAAFVEQLVASTAAS